MPSRLKLRPRSTPPTPPTDAETLFLDQADGALKSIDSDGVVTAIGAGGGAAEAGTVVVQLTGAETTYAHVYRGDEDPAVDFGAELVPGDQWIDTNVTAGHPFVRKVRNVANDGWDFDAMVVTDGAGVVIGSLKLNPDGSFLYGNSTVSFSIGADGAVELLTSTGQQFSVFLDGTILMGGLLGSGVSISPAGEITLRALAGDFIVDAVGLSFNATPIGTQAGNVPDVVGADPADIAATLNALLAAIKASGEMAPD